MTSGRRKSEVAIARGSKEELQEGERATLNSELGWKPMDKGVTEQAACALSGGRISSPGLRAAQALTVPPPRPVFARISLCAVTVTSVRPCPQPAAWQVGAAVSRPPHWHCYEDAASESSVPRPCPRPHQTESWDRGHAIAFAVYGNLIPGCRGKSLPRRGSHQVGVRGPPRVSVPQAPNEGQSDTRGTEVARQTGRRQRRG